jgi:hypothetical protein
MAGLQLTDSDAIKIDWNEQLERAIGVGGAVYRSGAGTNDRAE